MTSTPRPGVSNSSSENFPLRCLPTIATTLLSLQFQVTSYLDNRALIYLFIFALLSLVSVPDVDKYSRIMEIVSRLPEKNQSVLNVLMRHLTL